MTKNQNAEKHWTNLIELQEYYRDERICHPGHDYSEQLRGYISNLSDPPRDYSAEGAVIQRDIISEWAKDPQVRLIRPFDEDHLKTASYRLTVGDTYKRENHVKHLSREDEIEIAPFSVVVIRTREVINMPRFLIGRWNIKVSKAYDGLLWVGGPQVDPGYAGHLFCPIYNLSSEERTLSYGEELAVLDFIITTEFSGFDGAHDMEKPKNEGLSIEDYGPIDSALESEAAKKIEDNQGEIERLRRSFTNIQGITLAIIAILFAGLGVVASAGTSGSFSTNLTNISEWIDFGGTFLALIIALAAIVYARLK